MKALFILLLLAASPLFAQTPLDRIEKTDLSFIEGNVIKITEEHIEYKHANNLEGPVYTIAKNQVSAITYSNGFREEIKAVTSAPPTTPPAQANSATQATSYSQNQPNYHPTINTQAAKYENSNPREPLLAGVLSLIIPGAGQVYNKQYGKGIAMFGANVVSWVLAANSAYNTYDYDALYSGYYEEPNTTGTFVWMGLAVATNLYSVIDAAVSANKINERYGLISHLKVEPQTQFVLHGNQLQPTWGAKLTYSLR
ncbi:TM2 domain-containing membrane protein YozV [Catalinimonas alkaloidigena]|uniref:DUF5683 domain-containing protein n=1 Tax=Catalinimonas alkaloidigena TaxID=1075417 RepID=UPI002405DE64|nr:DUF5683 domain-containing protein [Catalinimonas alkaloidigena]MDF9794972.1 TM2 domain-containing membrane protein YozV [Catalinimonas alkaloidigena]